MMAAEKEMGNTPMGSNPKRNQIIEQFLSLISTRKNAQNTKTSAHRRLLHDGNCAREGDSDIRGGTRRACRRHHAFNDRPPDSCSVHHDLLAVRISAAAHRTRWLTAV